MILHSQQAANVLQVSHKGLEGSGYALQALQLKHGLPSLLELAPPPRVADFFSRWTCPCHVTRKHGAAEDAWLLFRAQEQGQGRNLAVRPLSAGPPTRTACASLPPPAADRLTGGGPCWRERSSGLPGPCCAIRFKASRGPLARSGAQKGRRPRPTARPPGLPPEP